jgi:putative membrane-bound dehydrogenase-like protein
MRLAAVTGLESAEKKRSSGKVADSAPKRSRLNNVKEGPTNPSGNRMSLSIFLAFGFFGISISAAWQAPATKNPPTPVLTPQEELKSFQIAPGYRVELVASEPLIHDPVAMTFDPDGRIWVCEMRGFMPDVNAKGEKEPVGSIAVLEDTDDDGVMDKRTLFLDGLVLPRGLCWTTDGILVAANGKLWLCRAQAGELTCREKVLVCEYNAGNPEYALNGLMPALDNWIYNAREGIRLRRSGDRWLHDATLGKGQWGMTQDDQGCLVYNVNAQLIRGDLVPCYSANAHSVNPYVNVALFKEQHVWPIRPNPGINRGYVPSFLRPDGTMVDANANCGPVVYRGDNLPEELRGNVFIPEPAANLVRRQVFIDDNGRKSSKNAYEKKEFLASTDERFRPVNMYNAPDGTLYLVDMYRGVIQYGAFMTTYLHQYIVDHDLDKPIGLGRIFRIVHESSQKRPRLALTAAKSAELTTLLSSPNGWHRDMAQRLLVSRNDAPSGPALEQLALKGASPLGRLHALWTLEGINRLDDDMLTSLLTDADPSVRASALALCRRITSRQAVDPAMLQPMGQAARDADGIVRMQAVFTLGLVNHPIADRAIEPILREASAKPDVLEGLLAGFNGREMEFVATRLAQPGWHTEEAWRQKVLAACAGLLWRQRQPLTVLRFLHLIGSIDSNNDWQQLALLEGLNSMPDRTPRAGGARLRPPPRQVVLPTAPASFEALRHSNNARISVAAEAFSKQLVWPGKDGKPLPVVPPLPAKYQALYDLGRKEYLGLCAACHHAAGYGDAGKGPPLLDSEWLDQDERLTRLVLFGLRGPLSINGQPFNPDGALEMPAMYKALDDEKIAGILTFVRREFRDGTGPIEPAMVTRIRKAMAGRTDQWTEKELRELK